MGDWYDVSCQGCGTVIHAHIEWSTPPKYCSACKPLMQRSSMKSCAIAVAPRFVHTEIGNKHAAYIEDRYRDSIPEISLGKSISDASPYIVKNKIVHAISRLVVTDTRYKSTKELHSDAKIELLYKPIIYVLLIFVLPAFYLFGGILVGDNKGVLDYLIDISCQKIIATNAF